MFYCGIDIAKYKHEASVIDTNGKALSASLPAILKTVYVGDSLQKTADSAQAL